MADNVQGVRIPIGVTVDPAATNKLHEILDAAEKRTKRVIQGIHDTDAGASNATKNALDRNLKAIQHHYEDINDIIERNGTKLSQNVLARADKVTASIANSVNESQRSLQNIVTGGQGGGGFGIGRQILGAGLAIAGARSLASVVTETINKTEEYAKIASTLGQRYGGFQTMWDAGRGGRGWFNPAENLNLQGRMAAAAGTTNIGTQIGLVRQAETLTGALGIGDKGETFADLAEALRMGGVKPEKIEKLLEQVAKNTGMAGEIAKANPQAFAMAIIPVLTAMQRLGPISGSSLNAVIAETTMAYRTSPATAQNFPQTLANIMSNAPNLAMGKGDPFTTNAMFAAAREMYPGADAQELAEIVSEPTPELLARFVRKAEQMSPAMRSKLRAMYLLSRTGGGVYGATEAGRNLDILAGRTPVGVGPLGAETDIAAAVEQFKKTPEHTRLTAASIRYLKEVEVGKHITPYKQFMDAHPEFQAALDFMAIPAATALILKSPAMLRAAAPLLAPVVATLLSPELLVAAGGAAATYGSYKAGSAMSSWGGNLLYNMGRMFGTDYEGSRYAESMIGPRGRGGGTSAERFKALMKSVAVVESAGAKGGPYGARGVEIHDRIGGHAVGKYQMRMETARDILGMPNLTEDEFRGDPNLQEIAGPAYMRFLLSRHHGDEQAALHDWAGYGKGKDASEYIDKVENEMSKQAAQHVVVDLTPDAQKLIRIMNLQGRVPEMRPH
jgi:hypothetical protein